MISLDKWYFNVRFLCRPGLPVFLIAERESDCEKLSQPCGGCFREYAAFYTQFKKTILSLMRNTAIFPRQTDFGRFRTSISAFCVKDCCPVRYEM